MVYKKREPLENFAYLELVRQTAQKVFLPDETVRLVLEGLLDTMRDALSEKKRIILREFGTLKPTIRHNIKMGDFVAVFFKSSPALRNFMKKELLDGR